MRATGKVREAKRVFACCPKEQRVSIPPHLSGSHLLSSARGQGILCFTCSLLLLPLPQDGRDIPIISAVSKAVGLLRACMYQCAHMGLYFNMQYQACYGEDHKQDNQVISTGLERASPA